MGQICSKQLEQVDFDTPLSKASYKLAADVAAEPKPSQLSGTQSPVAEPLPSTPGSIADSASSVYGAFMSWAQQQSAMQKQPLDAFLISSVKLAAEACLSPPAPEPATPEDSRLSVELQQMLEALASSSEALESAATEHMEVAPLQPYDGYQLGAPVPPCHDQRVLTAGSIYKLRATRDGEIESVLRLLCTVFESETATMALLTGECVYITGACGALWPCVCPDRWGFCGWSFLNAHHQLLVVEDMDNDMRFADNYFVIEKQFHLKFYIAAPLITADGHRLGTLCIMGQQARKFDATRAQLLANMAELLVRQLERNWVMQLQDDRQGKQLARSVSVYDSACIFVDVSKPVWRVLHMNLPAIDQLGIKWEANYAELPNNSEGRFERQPFDGLPISDVFDLDNSGAEWVSGSWEFTLHGVRGAACAGLQDKLYDLHFRLATSDGLDSQQPFYVGVPSWLSIASDDFGRSLFFVRVSEAVPPSRRCSSSEASEPESSTLPVPPLLRTHGSMGSGGSATSRSSSSSWMPRGLLPLACPIEGLVLGPLLGRGSYGRVYRGVFKGKRVAVKIIDDLASMRRDAAGKPLEAFLTMGLGHLGIMRTLDFAFAADTTSRSSSNGGLRGHTCWMMLEYCDCGSIADAVLKGMFRTDRHPTKGSTNLRAVLVTAYEIASAMAYLHSHDVVHGDLCGGNVMLAGSTVNPHGFSAKVGDFGLARQAVLTRCAQPAMYGTATHMPPEALLDGQLGKPTDVYSFGVLLWEMLTSSRAWAGMKHAQIVCQVALLRRQLAVPCGLPEAIEKLLRSCLAPVAAERCSFAEAVCVLSEFLQTTAHQDLSSAAVQLPGVGNVDTLVPTPSKAE